MSLKNMSIGIFVIFVLALLFSEGEPKKYAHWSYDEDEGPKEWSSLDERYNMCEEGLNQSPINIKNSTDANLTPLLFQGDSKATTFENNGKTLKVKFDSGNYLTVNDDKFSLKQMHFHTPSEHQIDGKSFPMEAHLVHKNAYNNLVVVAVMFEVSSEDNLTLNKLLRNLPKLPEDEDETTYEKLKSQILGYEILPSNKEYFTYNGSLTTPPCNEGVRWIIIKKPIKISKSQLNDFKNTMVKNNRPLQDTNSRYILH